MEEILYDGGDFKVTSTRVSYDDGQTLCQNILMEEISASTIESKDIFPYTFMIILFLGAGIWNYFEEYVSTKTYIILAFILYAIIYVLLNKTMWEHTLFVHSTGGQSLTIVFSNCEREKIVKIKDTIDNASAKRKEELSKNK